MPLTRLFALLARAQNRSRICHVYPGCCHRCTSQPTRAASEKVGGLPNLLRYVGTVALINPFDPLGKVESWAKTLKSSLEIADPNVREAYLPARAGAVKEHDGCQIVLDALRRRRFRPPAHSRWLPGCRGRACARCRADRGRAITS